jgi:hypothetical protein
MGGSARIVFLGWQHDGRRIDGAPTFRIPHALAARPATFEREQKDEETSRS